MDNQYIKVMTCVFLFLLVGVLVMRRFYIKEVVYLDVVMGASWNNFDQSNNPFEFDLELLKKEVGKRFPFYDMSQNVNAVAFFCRIDMDSLEANFDSLRRALSKSGYIPMLRYERGEHIIFVVKKQVRKERPVWVNYFLLIATVITCVLTGSILYMGFLDIWSLENILDVFIFDNLFFGAVLFALPLMCILFCHEMGHYYISKRHGISTSLPFFIPIPPVLPNFNIGTFGALISSRDPMPHKKALFDVGIAGPLAGFIIALPVAVVGIMMSEVVPGGELVGGQPVLGFSLLFLFLSDLILDIPEGFAVNLSLVAFAGWIGMLITSVNLLPAGQLDGGHIFRAVLGEYQKYAGWLAVFIMVFTGWMVFALIIVFMMGMAHPPPLNDATELDIRRKLLFFVGLAILILCYIPFPIGIVP